MQTMQKITDLHKVPPRVHTHTDTHVRSAAQMQTRLSEKLMELRHRGLKSGSCTQRAREGGGKKEKRDEEHRHSYETHAGGKRKITRAGRGTEREHVPKQNSGEQ